MSPSTAELLTAVYQRLTTCAALLTVVPATRIRNHLPQDETLPFVRSRITTADEWDCKDADGLDVRLVCDCWTDAHGDLAILRMCDEITDCMQGAVLSMPNGKSFYCRRLSIATTVEPDGQTHHGIVTFRLLLSSAA